MIPKLNKPLAIQNLRPISLTSCTGKLYEHMVLNRLTPYLEDNGYIANTMFGFRSNLSAQDVLLQLKEEVIDQLDTYSKRAILALDVKGAFDNVSHDIILHHLNIYNCGEKMYQYVRNFLTDTTSTVRLGNLRSEKFTLPSKGTTQGSVISPMLFNLAMSSLPNQLKQIKGIRHALYADELTIWTTGGSTGTQQDQLQEAVQITEQYLATCGLSCAPEKSELLILRRRTRGRPPQEVPDPEVTLGGISIPKVSTLRILGLLIQKDGTGGAELEKLQRTVQQVTHLIKRVANKRHGLKQEDCIIMIQALLTSTITYGTPYVGMKNGQRNKVNILIRKALRLPWDFRRPHPRQNSSRWGFTIPGKS